MLRKPGHGLRRALITSAPHSAQMGFKLESLHLYRKIPRDLTDATASGGAISLVCAMVMAYLFISNINEYLKLQTTTDVALDDTGEVHMRIFFNITMVSAHPALELWSWASAARRGVGLAGPTVHARAAWALVSSGSGGPPTLASERRRMGGVKVGVRLRRSDCLASLRWWTWRTSWGRR